MFIVYSFLHSCRYNLVTHMDEYPLHDFSHSVYHVGLEVSCLIKFSIQYTTIQLTKVSSFFQWELTGVSGPLLMYSFITARYQWHFVYQRLLTSRHSLLGHAVSSLLRSRSGQSQAVLPAPHDARSNQHTILSHMFCGFVWSD